MFKKHGNNAKGKVFKIWDFIKCLKFEILALLGLLLMFISLLLLTFFSTDEQKISTEITNSVNYLWDNNSYILIQVGKEEFIGMYHNKDREAYVQTPIGHTVYRNDDKIVIITDKAVIEHGVSPLRLIELALNLAKKSKAMLKVDEIEIPDDSNKKFQNYSIIITGEKGILDFYTQINKEYAKKMADQLLKDIPGRENIKLIFSIIKDKNNLIACRCYLTDGETIYPSWYFDKYLPVFNWVLPKAWYKEDFNDGEWENLIKELADEIKQKSTEFIKGEGMYWKK